MEPSSLAPSKSGPIHSKLRIRRSRRSAGTPLVRMWRIIVKDRGNKNELFLHELWQRRRVFQRRGSSLNVHSDCRVLGRTGDCFPSKGTTSGIHVGSSLHPEASSWPPSECSPGFWVPACMEPPAAGSRANEAVISEQGWILWSGSWASWGRSSNHRKPQSERWNRGEKRLKEWK